jgi:hypothetical protein
MNSKLRRLISLTVDLTLLIGCATPEGDAFNNIYGR